MRRSERMIELIQVSKEDMKKLRERFPFIRATRTVHKYYVEESPEVMSFLKNGQKGRAQKHA